MLVFFLFWVLGPMFISGIILIAVARLREK